MPPQASVAPGPFRLEPVVEALPVDFDQLRDESRAEGYRFLDRLANEWTSGAIRFDQPGEVLLVAYSGDDRLAGVGGLTVDPEIPEALRMRRFYVRKQFRRNGVGRAIAETLLERALKTVDIVTLNAAPASFRFWEKLGFVLERQSRRTHVLRSAQTRTC